VIGKTRKDQQVLSDRGDSNESGTVDAQLVRNRKTEDFAGGGGGLLFAFLRFDMLLKLAWRDQKRHWLSPTIFSAGVSRLGMNFRRRANFVAAAAFTALELATAFSCHRIPSYALLQSKLDVKSLSAAGKPPRQQER
jgi:hypothetical protein